PEVVSDEEATPRDKEIEKLMALISVSLKKIYKPTNNNLRTSSNTRNKNVDNTPRSDRRIGDSGSAVDWDLVFQLQRIWACSKECKKEKRNITSDTSDMCNDEGDINKDTTEEEERALLASLITNLKLKIDENKKINKDMKNENMSLNRELKRYKVSNYVKEADNEIANAYDLLKEQKDK
nr:hypothetical protein [Tanacetum cinerariifolium]